VHAAAIKPADLTGRVQAGQSFAVASQEATLQVGLQAVESLAGEDAEPDGYQRGRLAPATMTSVFIGLLGWKPGRAGPGGNPSACRWKAVRSILLGDNQVRHCLAVPAVNCGRACRGSAWRLGSFGPVCEARNSTRCLRVSGWNPGHSWPGGCQGTSCEFGAAAPRASAVAWFTSVTRRARALAPEEVRQLTERDVCRLASKSAPSLGYPARTAFGATLSPAGWNSSHGIRSSWDPSTARPAPGPDPVTTAPVPSTANQ
jgi:hypothetical protein